MPQKLKSIPFGERPGDEPYNASEVLALSDSRFVFCDNNVSDALFEFRLGRDGSITGRIARRRIEGLTPGSIDGIEGIEVVEAAGRTFIFGTSSLCLKTRKGHTDFRRVDSTRRLAVDSVQDRVEQLSWSRSSNPVSPAPGRGDGTRPRNPQRRPRIHRCRLI